jgi:hypothetical protein
VCTTNRYWVFQIHVTLEGLSIVKVTDVAVPEDETLPVPVHPMHTYRVPADPETGEVADALMDFPLSNHPLVGVHEPLGESASK